MKFEFEVVTPAIVGAADTRLAEIRPPSIRGCLRYWFRALAGGIIGSSEADLPRIRRAEADVFGDTDRRSPITIRLTTDVDHNFLSLPAGVETGHHTAVFDDKFVGDYFKLSEFPGIRYLGFPLFFKPQQRYPRGIVRDGAAFELEFLLRGDLRRVEELTNLIGALVWVWTHFGGIGYRTRRGFGSLRVKLPNAVGRIGFSPQGSSSIGEYFSGNFAQCTATLANVLGGKSDRIFKPVVGQIPTFTTFANWRGALVNSNGKPWTNWNLVMHQLGSYLRSYRVGKPAVTMPRMTEHTPDYSGFVAAYFQNAPEAAGAMLTGPLFGLPRQFRSATMSKNFTEVATRSMISELKKQLAKLPAGAPQKPRKAIEDRIKRYADGLEGHKDGAVERREVGALMDWVLDTSGKGDVQGEGRRASPIWIRPMCVSEDGGSGNWCGLVAVFPAQFLPPGSGVRIHPKDDRWPSKEGLALPATRSSLPVADVNILLDFVDSKSLNKAFQVLTTLP